MFTFTARVQMFTGEKPNGLFYDSEGLISLSLAESDLEEAPAYLSKSLSTPTNRFRSREHGDEEKARYWEIRSSFKNNEFQPNNLGHFIYTISKRYGVENSVYNVALYPKSDDLDNYILLYESTMRVFGEGFPGLTNAAGMENFIPGWDCFTGFIPAYNPDPENAFFQYTVAFYDTEEYAATAAIKINNAYTYYSGYLDSSRREVLQAFYDVLAGNIIKDKDPYNKEEDDDPDGEPDGSIDLGGGEPTDWDHGDPIPVEDDPLFNIADTGFVSSYVMTPYLLKGLASELWSSAFDISTFKKMFADPYDGLINLHIVPCSVSSAGTQQKIKLGSYETDVYAPKITDQFVNIPFTEITLPFKNALKNYLAFDPYTKMEIYLPFIGIRQLSCDDFYRGNAYKIGLHYKIDVISGVCIAYVMCEGNTVCTFSGVCSYDIPITGNRFDSMLQGLIQVGVAGVSMATTGGSATALEVATMASAASNMSKQSTHKAGSLNANQGFLAPRTPRVILTRPIPKIPENQNEFIGYPQYETSYVSALSGYTEFEQVFLSVAGEEEELREIEDILKTGVIL